MVIWSFLQLAGAQSACGSDPSTDVDNAIAAVNEAFRKVDEAAFDRASKALTAAVSCLDRPPSSRQVMELHKAMALASFVNGQIRACRRSLLSARLLDPGWVLDEKLYPPSHPYRDLFAGATDPGPVDDIGKITPDAWVVDGIPRNEAPTERAFLLQVSEGGKITWSGYLWDFEEIPDRGQVRPQSVLDTPHEWWTSLRVHGGGLYAAQTADGPAWTDQKGSTFAGGADLVARWTPVTVVGAELTAGIVAPSDPVLGGGGEPSVRGVLLLGGAGWVQGGQPWVAARLGGGVQRMRAWTNGPEGTASELFTRYLLIGGIEGGIRNTHQRLQASFDGQVVAPWNPYAWDAQIDGGALVAGPLALEGLIGFRRGGLDYHYPEETAVIGRRSTTDFRVGGGVALWY